MAPVTHRASTAPIQLGNPRNQSSWCSGKEILVWEITSEMESFAATMPTILCCMCGIDILQNPSNMCVTCLRASVDITAGIPRQLTIHSCRTCERWVLTAEEKVYYLNLLTLCCYRHTNEKYFWLWIQKPSNWVLNPLIYLLARHRFLCPPWQKVQLESKELMAACLRKIPGLSKVKLIGDNHPNFHDQLRSDYIKIFLEAYIRRIGKIFLLCKVEVTLFPCSMVKAFFPLLTFFHGWFLLCQVRLSED